MLVTVSPFCNNKIQYTGNVDYAACAAGETANSIVPGADSTVHAADGTAPATDGTSHAANGTGPAADGTSHAANSTSHSYNGTGDVSDDTCKKNIHRHTCSLDKQSL